MEVPANIRFECIEEYKASIDFKDKLVEASLIGFIQGFKDCKECMKKMVSKLDLRCLRPSNNDKEVGRIFFRRRLGLHLFVFAFGAFTSMKFCNKIFD